MDVNSTKVSNHLSSAIAFAGKTRVRYMILLVLFVITTINYADRAVISIAGTPMSKELGLDAVSMGYVFSAFSWAYVIGQLPGGWFLDRFGSKLIYTLSIFFWSFFTITQGFIGFFSTGIAITMLFVLRFMVGLSEAPSFPANSRIVSAWFPTKERGMASAIFNSAQYFATVIFAPIMGWLTSSYGWKSAFVIMGLIGIVLCGVWVKTIYGPKDHPRVNQAELDYLEQGGALVNLDQAREGSAKNAEVKWGYLKQLLTNRMTVGIYTAQYCLNTLTYFFLTWFPVYLVKERGMSILKAGFVASLPALCGFMGGILGGLISDYLLRRGKSLSVARKTPIVIGMLLSTSMIICNYVKVDWLIVSIMALAFFGKGIGALGWAVVSDTSPKEIGGLSGGLFNTFGNLAGITTPIIIGYILKATGSFNGALIFVGANAFMVILCYLLIVGEIKRVELKANS
ncbi:ACS family glucarate transporter-like MFS transporter [Paenibacillus sp. V4I3]|uniref:MFS transporter n=1 Tax=unclassified Paenibacillus TaxID=185978 RepID=UPI0027812F84|nr:MULTISPECIES: MFS transporter [unclassified Paenibacillus]MDQ0875826.1 ACS family glucarate transporter-like MFS transporter [Paenibacillus sp. V4I3]MDQ0888104.1 ACS family glucarate transporter-like MFS transporter [Paenibacillus sp. V4I9]